MCNGRTAFEAEEFRRRYLNGDYRVIVCIWYARARGVWEAFTRFVINHGVITQVGRNGAVSLETGARATSWRREQGEKRKKNERTPPSPSKAPRFRGSEITAVFPPLKSAAHPTSARWNPFHAENRGCARVCKRRGHRDSRDSISRRHARRDVPTAPNAQIGISNIANIFLSSYLYREAARGEIRFGDAGCRGLDRGPAELVSSAKGPS